MKIVLRGILAVTIATAGTGWGQQAAAPAQVSLTGPDLASTMKALEENLRSTGRLTWSQNAFNLQKGVLERKTFWEEVTNVAANPKTCSLRVQWQKSEGSNNFSTFLEEISNVDVLTSDDFLHRYHHTYVSGQADYQENLQPSLWSVGVSDWGLFDLKFPTKQAAEQAAALLRESIKQCTAIQVPPRLAASAVPNLTETLSFIADKLSSQGRVGLSWTANPTTGGGETGDFTTTDSWDYFNASPTPSHCSMGIEATDVVSTYHNELSFGRIGKIEVLKYKDYAARLLNGYQIKAASPVFVLAITTPGSESKQLYFSDETLANRVAKAMVHAAELCGAGANREPF